MSKLTPFGKSVRERRIDKEVTQADVAKALGISVAFLSAIENGNKNVPGRIFNLLCHFFDLDVDECRDLRDLADLSKKEVRINMQGKKDAERKLLLSFARVFDNDKELDKETMNKLNTLLEQLKWDFA